MNLRTLTALAATLMLPAITAHAQAAADTASIWTLQGENASITAGTPPDRFYVNGLRLGWTSPTGQVPDFLADLGHTLWGGGQQRVRRRARLGPAVLTQIDEDHAPFGPPLDELARDAAPVAAGSVDPVREK